MKSSELILELAKSSDAVRIAAMSRDLIEEGLEWSWKPERVAASIRSLHAHVLVGRAGNEMAGFAIMRYGDDTAHLDLFAVAPRHRRRSVGRRLLVWLEQCVVAAGIFEIHLEVRADNRGAQTFYERIGYRTLAYLPGYYQGREAAIRMGRRLDRSQGRTGGGNGQP